MNPKGNFIIRKASLRDLETVVRMRRAMWEAMDYRDKKELDRMDTVYRAWARNMMKRRSLITWLAFNRSGEAVGGGGLWLRPTQPHPGIDKKVQPYLLSMYTEPTFRGNGIGSRIVKEATKWAKLHGHPQVRLHASEMGRHVYAKQGFKRSWEMKLEFKSD